MKSLWEWATAIRKENATLESSMLVKEEEEEEEEFAIV